MLKAVDQPKLREGGEIGYDIELRRGVLWRKDPHHVAVPKAIDDRRVGITWLVGEAMMFAVVRDPPQRTSLRGGRPGEGADELNGSADLESSVGKAAMVKRRDPEGAYRVRDNRGDERKITPADEEDTEKGEMGEHERCPEPPWPLGSARHRSVGLRIDEQAQREVRRSSSDRRPVLATVGRDQWPRGRTPTLSAELTRFIWTHARSSRAPTTVTSPTAANKRHRPPEWPTSN